MSKVSVPISNKFCPQTLFLYGTYKEDGTPNFGLFCWLSYCWTNELAVMACIGGDKLTKKRIMETGIFSANLVTEAMLPLADFCGNHEGYSGEKKIASVEAVKGQILDVPVLACSPWCFELEVSETVNLEGSDIFICKIRNVLAETDVLNSEKSLEGLMAEIAPVSTTSSTYFSWTGETLGAWGESQKKYKFKG